MSKRFTIGLLTLAGTLGGCVHSSDIMMPNPLAEKRVQQNRVVKAHAYAESQNGLPPGSLEDEARLLSATEDDICFSVVLRELAPIDVARATFELSAPKVESVKQAKLVPEPPRVTVLDGQVPERHEAGTETYCSYRDSNGLCQSWKTRQLYTTEWVPGPVKVYESRGRACFANDGIASETTLQISLEVRVQRRMGPTAVAGMGMGMWGMGGFGDSGDKKTVFRWGFGK